MQDRIRELLRNYEGSAIYNKETNDTISIHRGVYRHRQGGDHVHKFTLGLLDIEGQSDVDSVFISKELEKALECLLEYDRLYMELGSNSIKDGIKHMTDLLEESDNCTIKARTYNKGIHKMVYKDDDSSISRNIVVIPEGMFSIKEGLPYPNVKSNDVLVIYAIRRLEEFKKSLTF